MEKVLFIIWLKLEQNCSSDSGLPEQFLRISVLSASVNLNGKYNFSIRYISQFEIQRMARYSWTGKEGRRKDV